MDILKKLFYIFLEWRASKRRDKIIVLGEREKQIAINYKICEADKLGVINHAIPEIKFLTKEDALLDLNFSRSNIPQNKIIAGTIANNFPSKGLEYFKKAANLLNNYNIELVNIGELLQTSHTLTNAARYLKVLDIFILPSIKEGAPYVILEAMSAGLPIVATDVGNVAEMLQNYPNKIIVPPADPEALAKAIKAIREIDPKCTEYKSDFTNYIEKMKKLYNNL